MKRSPKQMDTFWDSCHRMWLIIDDISHFPGCVVKRIAFLNKKTNQVKESGDPENMTIFFDGLGREWNFVDEAIDLQGEVVKKIFFEEITFDSQACPVDENDLPF